MPLSARPAMGADPLPDLSVNAVLELVRRRAGLVFSPARRRDVENAISAAMVRARVSDPGRLLQRLIAEEAAFAAFIADLTVGETYFLRESAQIEILRRLVLPDLVQRRGNAHLRLWSAGCASGEEAYSLAMLLEQQGITNPATIIGTDISQAALDRARAADYGAWSLRGVAPDVIAKFFLRRGDRYLLVDRLRRPVTFGLLNLAAPDYRAAMPGLGEMDLILCRNVLIYFATEAVEAIAGRLHAALSPGGWLVTGPSDPPLWSHAPFETVVTAGGVFYRRRLVPDLTVRPPSARPVFTPHPVFVERQPPPEPLPGLPPMQPVPEVAPPAVPPPDPRPDIRALADAGDPRAALAAATAALDQFPLDAELHYLRAVLQLDLGEIDEAAATLRRVLYLDGALAVAHLTLGTVLRRLGAPDEARRAFRNAYTLCAALPADAPMLLAEGEPAGRLAAAAEAQLAALDGGVEKSR